MIDKVNFLNYKLIKFLYVYIFILVGVSEYGDIPGKLGLIHSLFDDLCKSLKVYREALDEYWYLYIMNTEELSKQTRNDDDDDGDDNGDDDDGDDDGDDDYNYDDGDYNYDYGNNDNDDDNDGDDVSNDIDDSGNQRNDIKAAIANSSNTKPNEIGSSNDTDIKNYNSDTLLGLHSIPMNGKFVFVKID